MTPTWLLPLQHPTRLAANAAQLEAIKKLEALAKAVKQKRKGE